MSRSAKNQHIFGGDIIGKVEPIIHISSYSEFKSHFGGLPRSGLSPYYYRGLRADYPLLPSICYSDLFDKIKDLKVYEERILIEFEKLLTGELENPITKNDWELWFMARHFGLKSRLIDFSKDDTIAMQFAFENSNSMPVKIYCLNKEGLENVYLQTHLQQQKRDPFSFNKLCIIQPTPLYVEYAAKILGVSRIMIQSGKFLYQPLSTVTIPLTEQIPSRFWKVFQVNTQEDMEAIKMEIRKTEGIDMTKSLLKHNHVLDEKCVLINISCVG